jgi:restriction endonuclease S subunit
MRNWEKKPIKDVVIDLHQGLNTAGYKIKFYDTGYPIIQTRNLDNGVIDLDEKMKFMSKEDWLIYKDKYKPNIGDVFLTNIGTIGKTAVVTEEQDYLIHWNIFIFKVDKIIIDPYYLKTFLDTPFCFDYYLSCQKGGTVNFITKKMIEVLEIPLPPLPVQQRIVTILDETFAAIAKAKANAEQNLKNAKELFESYLQGVFENKGEGWEEQLFENCFKLKSGDGLTSKNMSEDGEYPVFGGNGIAGLHDSFNLSGSNVIIGRVGALCGNVRHITENIWLTDNAFKVVDFKFEFDHSFLTYLLNYKNLRGFARQAAQPVISNSSLKDVVLEFPKSLKEQKEIVNKFDALSAETKKLEAIYKQKINDLEELKKSVLQKAFSGELKTATALV